MRTYNVYARTEYERTNYYWEYAAGQPNPTLNYVYCGLTATREYDISMLCCELDDVERTLRYLVIDS